MSWNYRVIRHDTKDGAECRIHEVYYGSDGTIEAWTEEPVSPGGESLDELLADLEHMLQDARAYPVLSLRELEASPRRCAESDGAAEPGQEPP